MADATPDNVYDAARYQRAGRGKIFDSILDTIGDTPLVRLPRLTAERKIVEAVDLEVMDLREEAF